MGLYVLEECVNISEGYGCGDSDVYESRFDNKKSLFGFALKEYGRCVSKMYIDKADGTAQQVGWVFQKKREYNDCKKYFILETWLSIHEKPPTKTTTYHYAEIFK